VAGTIDSLNTIRLSPNDQPPFTVQLSIGGALPYEWDLYLYRRQRSGWKINFLGRGEGDAPVSLGELTARELGGTILVWSLLAVKIDHEQLDVMVKASLRDSKKARYAVSQKWSITEQHPRIYLSVHLERSA